MQFNLTAVVVKALISNSISLVYGKLFTCATILMLENRDDSPFILGCSQTSALPETAWLVKSMNSFDMICQIVGRGREFHKQSYKIHFHTTLYIGIQGVCGTKTQQYFVVPKARNYTECDRIFSGYTSIQSVMTLCRQSWNLVTNL